MHKIDGAGNDSGRFVHENYETGRPPTEVTADWLNSVQEELIAILLAAGIVPDKANNAQVLAAIEFLIKKYAPEPDLSSFALYDFFVGTNSGTASVLYTPSVTRPRGTYFVVPYNYGFGYTAKGDSYYLNTRVDVLDGKVVASEMNMFAENNLQRKEHTRAPIIMRITSDRATIRGAVQARGTTSDGLITGTAGVNGMSFNCWRIA